MRARSLLLIAGAIASACGASPSGSIASIPPPARTPDIYLTLTDPVRVQQPATAFLVTAPGAVCSISLTYPGAPPPSDFIAKTATARGEVQWVWTVTPQTPPGRHPAEVRCDLPSGRRATARASFEVR